MPEIINCWDQIGFPILSLITYLPLLGALFIIFFTPKDKTNRIKYTAFGVSFITFLLSLLLLPKFITNRHCIQFAEKFNWIKAFGIQYYLGVDGISILLVLLTNFLSAIAILASFESITVKIKEYYVMFLILQTGMLGVFLSLDLFLFYIFWEVMLVPMYFIIGIWGGPGKLYAAIKFFLYTFIGSLVMLLAILALYFIHHQATGEYTFELFKLYHPRIPLHLQTWLFLAFALGFAIKVPMVPFHTWLPDAHVEAPTAGSVILAGILLKMGTYGFVRFCLPLFPAATVKFIPLMVSLAIIGIIYGALTSLMQGDMKKLIAYSSVSHLGFVMLGIFTLNFKGLTGGMLQMINHGLSTGALFLIVGLIYDRRHTRLISELRGLSKQMPIYSILFLIIALSSMGMPGLNGFIGEIYVVMGAYQVNFWWAFAAVIGILLGASYLLWLYQRTMFGDLDHPENKILPDLNWREIFTLVPIIIFCLWIGLYPSPYLKLMEASINFTLIQTEIIQKPENLPGIQENIPLESDILWEK